MFCFCKTRTSIYNMDVVNWCNSILHGTTDILSEQWVCSTQTHVQALTRMCQFRSNMDVASSTQQRRFGFVRNSQSKMYMDVHFWRAARAEADIPYQVLYIRVQHLITSLTRCQTRCWAAEGRRRISFFPFVFRYAAVLERERKNLPPMMQEREKDWSRRPVFA